jgi:hypothetical protein
LGRRNERKERGEENRGEKAKKDGCFFFGKVFYNKYLFPETFR